MTTHSLVFSSAERLDYGTTTPDMFSNVILPPIHPNSCYLKSATIPQVYFKSQLMNTVIIAFYMSLHVLPALTIPINIPNIAYTPETLVAAIGTSMNTFDSTFNADIEGTFVHIASQSCGLSIYAQTPEQFKILQILGYAPSCLNPNTTTYPFSFPFANIYNVNLWGVYPISQNAASSVYVLSNITGASKMVTMAQISVWNATTTWVNTDPVPLAVGSRQIYLVTVQFIDQNGGPIDFENGTATVHFECNN